MPCEIPLPENIVEYPMGDSTKIVCRWNRDTTVLSYLMVFWGAIGGLVGIIWYGLSGSSDMQFDMPQQMGTPLKLILLLVAFLAIAIAYGLIVKFVNFTEIWISPTSVIIAIRPLPWIGQAMVSLSRSEITRLFVEEQSKKDSYGKVIKNYELHFVDPSGKCQPLIRLLRVHEALYLRSRLGEILGIDDLSVGDACCV